MNAEEITHNGPQTGNVGSVAIHRRHSGQQSTQRVLSAAPLRYVMLATIALLLTALSCVAIDWIRETEAHLDAIHARVASMPIR